MNAFQRRVVRLARQAVAFAALVLGSHGGAVAWAQVPNAAAAREQVFWEALESVLSDGLKSGRYTVEEVQQVRVLRIGSWATGTATEASDIDATVAGPTNECSERLAQDVNSKVDALLEQQHGRAGALKARAKINVIRDADLNFDQLYKESTGQAFIRDMVNPQPGARQCTAFEWRTVNGTKQLTRVHLPSDCFWIDRNLPVPRVVSNPSQFVADSLSFIQHSRQNTASLLESCLECQKYVNRCERWLKPRLSTRYGTDLPAQMEADRDLLRKIEQLADLKKRLAGGRMPAAEKELELLGEILGRPGENPVQSVERFFAESERYLTRMRGQVQVLEDLRNAGTLQDLLRAGKDLDEALRVGTSLRARLLLEAAKLGKPLNEFMLGIGVAMVIKRLQFEGPAAAAEETALLAASCGMPLATLTAVVAQLAKDLFVVSLTKAGNYFLFDKFNRKALDQVLADGRKAVGLAGEKEGPSKPGNEPFYFDLFAWDESPFHGMSLITLAYFFPDERDQNGKLIKEGSQRLTEAVQKYVSLLRDHGVKGFAVAGAGNLAEPLSQELLAWWQESQRRKRLVEAMATSLVIGKGLNVVDYPVRLEVDSQWVESGAADALRIEKAVPPGRDSVAFRIDLRCEFDQVQKLENPSEYNQIVDVWGKTGPAGLQAWLSEHTEIIYRESYAPLSVILTAGEAAPGWSVSCTPTAGWAVPLPDLGKGLDRTTGTVDLPKARLPNMPMMSRSQYVLTFKLRDSARATSVEPARVRAELRYWNPDADWRRRGSARAPVSPTAVFRFVLVAHGPTPLPPEDAPTTRDPKTSGQTPSAGGHAGAGKTGDKTGDKSVGKGPVKDERVETVAEFRRMWPAVLQRELGRNPQHSRVEMIANAVEAGPDKYRCAYNWWCWIKTSQGKKESVGYRHDRIVSLQALKSDVALWKRLYGEIGKE